jgi:hypothetical protein
MGVRLIPLDEPEDEKSIRVKEGLHIGVPNGGMDGTGDTEGKPEAAGDIGRDADGDGALEREARGDLEGERETDRDLERVQGPDGGVAGIEAAGQEFVLKNKIAMASGDSTTVFPDPSETSMKSG